MSQLWSLDISFGIYLFGVYLAQFGNAISQYKTTLHIAWLPSWWVFLLYFLIRIGLEIYFHRLENQKQTTW